MIRSSNICFLLCVIAFTLLSTSGNCAPTAPQHSASKSAGITLSPAQKARYNARTTKFKADFEALKANKSLSPTQKQSRFKILVAAYNSDLMTMLNPDQRAIVKKQQAMSAHSKIVAMQRFDTFKQAHLAEYSKGDSAAHRLDISLTPQQKALNVSLNKSLFTLSQQLHADTTMSPQAKQAKWTSAQQTMLAKWRSALKPSQLKDFDSMMSTRQKLMAEFKASSVH